jgi:hypothetical protein
MSEIMATFLENVNLPHPNSKVKFGSLTVIPNKGETPIYMEELPSDDVIIYGSKYTNKIARAHRIVPIDDDVFGNVPIIPCGVTIHCSCVVS